MNLVFLEILIWSTSSKLRTYDTDFNFTGLRTTTSHKIFETNSSFHVKWRTTGKVLLLIFGTFLLVLTEFSFWHGGWVLDYHSM